MRPLQLLQLGSDFLALPVEGAKAPSKLFDLGRCFVGNRHSHPITHGTLLYLIIGAAIRKCQHSSPLAWSLPGIISLIQ